MPTHLLSRAAVRLRDIYLARATQSIEDAVREKLADYPGALGRACAALRPSSGGAASLTESRRQLHGLVKVFQRAVRQSLTELRRPKQPVPDLRGLMEELQQLDDEFDGVQVDFKQKTISVTTEPIELEGVHLGSFSIQLHWDRLNREPGTRSFDILALQPNPAARSDSVTHPHVNHDKLCAGDATVPIQRALEQGRLADAFCLVRSVLTTYNAGSPHVPLDEWNSGDCHECGGQVDPDDLSFCQHCGHDYCEDCMSACARCDECCCGTCVERCSRCNDHFCPRCLGFAESGERRCRSCLDAVADEPPADAIQPQQGSVPPLPEGPPLQPASELPPLPEPVTEIDDHDDESTALLTAAG